MESCNDGLRDNCAPTVIKRWPNWEMLVKQDQVNPHQSILPLIGLRDRKPSGFLGTATLVGPGGLLLTADHVIRDWDEEFGVVCISDLNVTYVATVVDRDPAHDLALLRAHGFPDHRILVPAFGKPMSPNVPVLTYEYGTTRAGGGRIDFSPATRLGNVTRFPNIAMLGEAGANALELSFSALKGASGAPVIDSRNWDIWGVIVANVSYELLPCQIETVLDEGNNLLEEVKFMLPQGAAVNINHLEPMYRRHVPV